MRRLLRAHFARLWGDRVFWLGVIGMAVCGALVCLSNYRTLMKYPQDVTIALENFFFFFCPVIGLFISVVLSLFLGTEYSEGTMRNKLMVGHRRGKIYLSSLLLGYAVTLLIMISGMLIAYLLGKPLFGPFQMAQKELMQMIFAAVMMSLSTASICVAISMCLQNRAVAAVTSLVVMLLMIFASALLGGRLHEPEIISDAVEFVDGVMVQGELRPNPNYLRGPLRTVAEWIYDLLPAGQAARLSNLETQRLTRLPWISLLVCVASSAAGFCLYRKKDIK